MVVLRGYGTQSLSKNEKKFCPKCKKNLTSGKVNPICNEVALLESQKDLIMAEKETYVRWGLSNFFVHLILFVIAWFVTYFINPERFYNLTVGILVITFTFVSIWLFMLYYFSKRKEDILNLKIKNLNHK